MGIRNHPNSSSSSSPSIPTITITITTIAATAILTRTISKYGLTGTLRYIWEGDHLTPSSREALDTLENMERKLIPKQRRKLEKIEIMLEVAKLNTVDDGESTDDSNHNGDGDNHGNNHGDNHGNDGDHNDDGDNHGDLNGDEYDSGDGEGCISTRSMSTMSTLSTRSIKTSNSKTVSIKTGSSKTTTSSKEEDSAILSASPTLSKELSTLSYNLDKLASDVDFVQSHDEMEVKKKKKELSDLLVKMMERVDELMKECGIVVLSMSY